MAGAAAMAGMAALRGGAGLVRLAVPEAVPRYGRRLRAVLHDRAAAGRRRRPDRRRPRSTASPNWPDQATVVACGPGLGRSLGLDELVVRLYQEIAKPMVFDADALNALAAEPEALAHPGGPRILTPHPGEFARLIGRKLDGEPATTRRCNWPPVAASSWCSRAIARW